ncbi:MAG: carboxypeptidase regulatory-like domain-containing protein [Anaerolineales bacterium]|nr:carboxypeptidase regulatory-like domain-containing protein [Anaerolineales bacterium]
MSLGMCAISLGALFSLVKAMPTATVTGVVVSQDGHPISGATVRIQATTNSTISALDGSFALDGLTEGVTVTVSAWKDKYYCAKVESVSPPASNITLTLRLYQTNDNPNYEWVLPTGTDSCYSCKPGVTQIWSDNDTHGHSGNNPRFLSLYNGTDITGTNIISPGYKLDFPGTAGNCAACHAPSAALDAPYTTDMSSLPDIDHDFGIHCDFCHKVADVYLNASTGLPYSNAPGVLSMDVRRPFPESERHQLFFGTFDDDNEPLEDTYLPIIEKSQWCATCHQFSFWGTPIYQSFKEWLESPYPSMGVECQTCHMPSDGIMTNVAPGMGGVERDPSTIHAHSMPGAASQSLLQNTVTMSLTAQVKAPAVETTVTITNAMAGHDVPTDHPGRHMILTLIATDSTGTNLPQTSGPVVPFWGGAQSGLPGKAYAKVLQDAVSGEYPVVSYWKQAFILSDNRISAFESDQSVYGFLVPQAGDTITVTAELLFRRNFQDEMDERGWGVQDIVMVTQKITLTIPAYTIIYLPFVVDY